MCDIGQRRPVVVKATARNTGTWLVKVGLRGPTFGFSTHEAVSSFQFRSLCAEGSCDLKKKRCLCDGNEDAECGVNV